MSHKSQALVEFALVLPMLLLVLSIIFDMSRVLYMHSLAQVAAREGARLAVIDPIDDHVAEVIKNIIHPWPVAVHVTRGPIISVRVETGIQLITPGMREILGYEISVVQTARMSSLGHDSICIACIVGSTRDGDRHRLRAA